MYALNEGVRVSNIELEIIPKKTDLGDNFVVRRSLPDRRKRMVGPFIFWDHMGPVTLVNEREMTVRAHPHIGLATITWLFSGEIMHRDSLGNEQVIKPGEVNWMTAGSGIVHSERAKSSNDIEMELEGIQLWLALPKEFEDVEASFYHCKQEDVPILSQEGFKLRLIAGKTLGVESPVPVYSDLFYINGEGEKDRNFHFKLEEDHEGAIYIVEGKVQVEDKIFEKHSLVIFKKNSVIDFKALTEVKFMCFGGKVFPEKRFIWWNFVSSDSQKIEIAKKNWSEGKFPAVINETEFIPLPKD